jgi:hypothetical protein
MWHIVGEIFANLRREFLFSRAPSPRLLAPARDYLPTRGESAIDGESLRPSTMVEVVSLGLGFREVRLSSVSNVHQI